MFPCPPPLPSENVVLAALQMHGKNIAVCVCVLERMLWGSALREEHLAIEHCRDAVGLGTEGLRCHGHCRDTVLPGTLLLDACRDNAPLSGTVGILSDWALQGYFAIRHCRDALRLGTAGILCSCALRAHLVTEHCRDTGWARRRYCRETWHSGDACRLHRDTVLVGAAGILGGWALHGYPAVCTSWIHVVGHCQDILWLGTAGIPGGSGPIGGWALQGYSSGTAGIFCNWALQGYSSVGHCRDTLRLGTAKKVSPLSTDVRFRGGGGGR